MRMAVLISKKKAIPLLFFVSYLAAIAKAEDSLPPYTGLAIGVIKSTDQTLGFFNSILSMHLSALPLGDQVYPGIPFDFSIDSDSLLHKSSNLEKAKLSQPVIVTYQINSPLMRFRAFSLMHRVKLVDIQRQNATKALSPWYDKHFEKPETTMKASGYLLRWYQQGAFDHLCSISIHLGGDKNTSKTFHSESLIGFDQQGRIQEDIVAKTINAAKQNVAHFNITSKEGCLVAKDYLVAGKIVEIGFARHYFHLFEAYKHTIHSLKFQIPTNSEIAER